MAAVKRTATITTTPMKVIREGKKMKEDPLAYLERLFHNTNFDVKRQLSRPWNDSANQDGEEMADVSGKFDEINNMFKGLSLHLMGQCHKGHPAWQYVNGAKVVWVKQPAFNRKINMEKNSVLYPCSSREAFAFLYVL